MHMAYCSGMMLLWSRSITTATTALHGFKPRKECEPGICADLAAAVLHALTHFLFCLTARASALTSLAAAQLPGRNSTTCENTAQHTIAQHSTAQVCCKQETSMHVKQHMKKFGGGWDTAN